jgi:flagellar hook assembly protein FlgD
VYLGSFSGTIRFAFLATSAYGNNMFIDDVRLLGGGVGIEEEKPNQLPTITTLNAPKPNPVINGIAHISFNIAEPTKASLKIYDASGKLVKTLVNEFINTGVYNLTWNGTDDNSNRVSDGIYFYTLETSSKNFTKKLVLTH